MSQDDDLSDSEIAAFADRLRAQLDELTAYDAASAADQAPVELDQTRQGRLSRMDALQGQAMAQATAERRSRQRARVRAALARIAADEFGYCVRCQNPIARARLDLDPAIPVCVTCAATR